MKIKPLKHKLEPKLKAKWLEALRSGKYRQGENYLRTGHDAEASYCCLGVLCDIIDPNAWEVRRYDPAGVVAWNDAAARVSDSSGPLLGNIYDALLQFCVEDVEPLTVHSQVQSVLMRMNDKQKLSFAEIATWIEENL